MPRRVALLSLVLAAGTVALPSAAQAADTYTVDGASATDSCTAAKVCKRILQAVAAVADNDTIVVKPGTYNETGKIALTHKGVTLQGTPGATIVTPATAAGEPAITLVEGDIVDGITVAPTVNTGPGILVTGRDTLVRNSAILRLNASTADAPAYRVDPLVIAGTNTLSRVTILNGPTGTTGQTQPAVLGSEGSTMAISDALVVSGVQQGPAVGLIGNDQTGDVPIGNTIVRSSLLASNPSADALSFVSAADSTRDKALTIDSSILAGGSNGSGLKAASAHGTVPNTDGSGDVSVLARHVTVAGASLPFYVDAAASGLTPVGNVEVTFDRSIVHGKSPGEVHSYEPLIPILLGAANTAKVTIASSDTNTSATPTGNASIVTTATTSTADASLFLNPAAQNYHLRSGAPVIDKGGEIIAGESVTDIDGDGRKSGPATDFGADEYVNHAPVASATASLTKAKQGQTVIFDGSKSGDPDGSSGVVKYRWFFGDGATAETTTPTTTHAYAVLGVFNPTLTVVDGDGLASAPAKIPTITVGDGAPPMLVISKPSKNGAYAITVSAKVGRKIKRVLDKDLVKRVTFAGKAMDASGIKQVRLSIRRLAIGTAKLPKAPKTCVYLSSSKSSFKTASCKKPVFFTVPNKTGEFSYHLKSTLRPKPGRYELAVQATDGAGVVSSAFTVRFKLK
jgi:hypothetical protein